MRAHTGIALIVALVVSALFGCTSLALARTATIEVAAPLQGQSEDALKAALLEAVQSAAKGALAMGLGWVQVSRAAVVGDSIAVQVVATDSPPQGTDGSADPGQAPEEQPPADSGPIDSGLMHAQADF